MLGGGSDFHENPRKVTVTSRRTKNWNYSCVTHGTVDDSSGDDETKPIEIKIKTKRILYYITYRDTNIIYVFGSFPYVVGGLYEL